MSLKKIIKKSLGQPRFNSSRLNRDRGQSMLELIVVVAVGLTIMTALVLTTISSLRNAQLAKNQSQATRLAQEGIELVRVGRDRNSCINALTNINSWDGNKTGACTNAPDPITGKAIWDYRISNNNCGNVSQPTPTYCWFNIGETGILSHFAINSSFPPSGSDPINTYFKRAIILSDDGTNWANEKKVTAIVKWTDFAGEHESRQTTILRKVQ